MPLSVETMRFVALLQGLFAVVLITLFWILYSRFRKSDFLRLWAWAWGAFAVGLVAGYLPPLMNLREGGSGALLSWVFVTAGFVHAALVSLGAGSFVREQPSSKKTTWWVTASAIAGTIVFLASWYLPHWITAWLGEGTPQVQPLQIRIVLRQTAIAAAFLRSAWIFWGRRTRSRLAGPQILAAACSFYGIYQVVYVFRVLLSFWQPGFSIIPPYFADLSTQTLLGLGLGLYLVDEYRRVVEARSEVETRFGGVAQNLGEGLLITDPNDIILFVNERMAQMTGYSIADLVGRPGYAMFLAERDWPVVWKKNQERMLGALDRYELQIRRRDGTPLWVEVSASPYRDVGGKIVGTLGAVTDITEKRRFEQALAASEEKFSKAFLSSPDAIAISTLDDGRYLEVNESFCVITGYSRQELIGRSTLELRIWAQPESRRRLVELLRAQKRVREFPVQYLSRAGGLTEGIISAELIDIRGEPCILSITRDVTEKHRAERLQAALYEIAQTTDSAPDLQAIFREVHRVIQQVMPAENFYIALYEDATNTLSFPYFVDAFDQPNPPGPPGRGNTAYVLRTGHSLLSPADVHEQLKAKGEVETVGAMSEVWLGVPLKTAGKTIGVMAVQHYRDRKAFGEKEQRILEFVSTQVAVAIQRKKAEAERQEAERALRVSEEKFSRAFHSSPDAMTISTFEESRFIEINESFVQLTGYSREEIIGRTSQELRLWAHPECRPEMSVRVRDTGRVKDFEFDLRRKDGAIATGLLSVDIIEVAGKKCFLSAVRDITTRKRMEEALRVSEAKFSKAFFASPDAMVISTLDTGMLLDVNDGFCRLSGYSREEAMGRNGLELGIWQSVSDRKQMIEHLRKGEGLRNMELNLRSKTGREVVGLLSAEVIEFGGRPSMLVVVRDITERKEMEKALRTSEERFRELFENANDIVYTHDMDGNFTSLNRTGELITGYSRAEAMQMNIRTILAPAQLEFAQRMIALKAQGRGPTTYELQIRSKDGRAVDVEVSTRIIQFGGKPVGVQGIARDISERRLAEKALRDSEERYRLIFDSTPLPIFVYDERTLNFLAVNDAAVRSYGYTREEFLRMTLKDIRPPEEVHYLVRRLQQDPMPVHTAVHRKKDGTLIDVEIRGHAVGLFGETARLVITEDITERVRSEQAIRESEAKFRTLSESSPYAILIARDMRVIFANRAAEEITGYSAAELAANDATPLLTPQGKAPVEEKRVSRQSKILQTQRYEIKFTTKSRTEKWLDVTTNVISFEGAPAVLVNAMDVTERKTVEDQLRQAQKMEAVGRLAGGVAHDFNNLLMIMRGYADLILDSGTTDEATRRNAEQITKAAERAAGLTQQLLAFSRKQVLAPQVLDLQQVMQGVHTMLRRLIGEDVDLVVSSVPNLWMVKADPNQIEQVVLNLAINARDAMPRGGKLIVELSNVELDEYFAHNHAGATQGPHVQLCVTDTGVGMTADVRARVFEPFFTTKEVGRGTGLGLATVYGIVKQSNGYISVYSEPGKGTSFKVYLPKVAEQTETPPSKDHPEKSFGTETILLVEDEADVRALAREFLDSRGYRVLEAQNGMAALHLSQTHPGGIDLLLTDVVMPGMSGRELAEQIGSVRPRMKVLFVSGYTAEAIGQHGILDPGTEFLQKPFSREALARKLREVLDKSN